MPLNKSPYDPAPDWIDQTYGIRISNALILFSLLGLLTKEEAIRVSTRIEEWFDKAEKIRIKDE